MFPLFVREYYFVFKFEYGNKIDMSSSELLYVYEKEGVVKDSDNTISDLPKRGKVELLTINGDVVCEGYDTFVKGIYFYISYCLKKSY